MTAETSLHHPPVAVPGQGLTLETIVPYLLQRKLLHPKDIVHGNPRIQDRSRRNRNFKVILPGAPGLLVKQVGNFTEASFRDSLTAEALLLRAAGRDESFGEVRWFVPRFLQWDPERLVLVTALVHPATSLGKFHLNGGSIAFPSEGGASPARLLAAFHHAGAAALHAGRLEFIPRNEPFAWNIPTFAENWARDGSGAAADFVRLLRERPEPWDRLPRLRNAWLAGGDLIHGDVRWDNYLLTHGEAPGDDLNLRLIDWELASRGDSAWDVASLLTEYVRFWLQAAAVRGASTRDEFARKAPFPLEESHASAHAAWEAYVERRALGRAARRAFFDRVLEFLPFTLALVGFEGLQRQDSLPASSAVALHMAWQAAEDPRTAAAAWFGLHEVA